MSVNPVGSPWALRDSSPTRSPSISDYPVSGWYASTVTERKPCRRCGGPKPPGAGRLYCDACILARQPVWQRADAERRLSVVRTASEKQKKAPDGMRWCPRHADYLPVDEFNMRGKKPPAYCKVCLSELSLERNLRTKFDMTLNEYDQLVEEQKGRCAICMRPNNKIRLAVDHEHNFDGPIRQSVRGLLCKSCNHRLLGAAHDRQWMLLRAAAYLAAPPARTHRPIEDLGEAA
jgi:hypothetical protein